MNPTPEISIIIVSYNTRDLLLRCLGSLQAEAAQLGAEILVVDNASSDRSAEAVRQAFPQVRWIANPDNLGFAAACNQGLAQTQAPYVCLVNPDTQAEAGALALLRQALDVDAQAWVAGPQLLNADGTLQPSGRRFPGLWRFALDGLVPERVRRGSGWQSRVFGRTDFTVPAYVDEVSGAFLLARREAFARAGGFDERYFLFFEEVDWFRRVAVAGGRVRYVPAAKVRHVHGGARQNASADSLAWHARSAIAYWRRWHGPAAALAARGILLLQAAAWAGGRLVRTLIGARPWSQLPGALRGYLRLGREALCGSWGK